MFAKLGTSGEASVQERSRHLKTAAQLYLQERQYKSAAAAANDGLELSPADPELLELAGQSSYMAGEFRAATIALERLVAEPASRAQIFVPVPAR